MLPGTHLAAAGYCMYGSATQLVLTFGKGVHQFTLDPSIGEFILTGKNLRIPENPKTVGVMSALPACYVLISMLSSQIYSINEGNFSLWSEPVKQYVEECKNKSPKP